MEQKTKRCAHCGQEKPVTEFYKDSHTRDGLQSWCKECSNSRSGNRRAIVSEINWEYRRYEIARTILPYCAETTRIILMGGHSIGDQFKGKSIPEAVSEQAAQYADALIEVLKRQEP